MDLFLTLGVGLFTVIGAILIFFIKDKDKIVHVSMNLAIGVIFSLIVLDLFPEIWEMLNDKYDTSFSIFYVFTFTLIGIFVLWFLDRYIHHHHHDDTRENFTHIGVVTGIAIFLHNLIEGMAVYGLLTKDFSLGIMVILGVGLHNIPLGMMLASAFYKSTNSKKKTLFNIILISLATFLGGLIMCLNLEFLLNDFFLIVLLLITNGMLLYISLFELLPHALHNKEKTKTIITIIIGALFILITHFLE